MSNALGAIVRALLVMLLIATPSLMLPPDPDTAQMTVLVSLFAGLLVLAEYATVYPSFIAFRDAAPYNRMRFLAIFTTLFGLCTILQLANAEGTALGAMLSAFGRATADLFDGPLSPLSGMTAALSPHLGADLADALVGWAALWGLACAVLSVAALAILRWPALGAELNLWINLPLFSPSGGDLTERLRRSAGINLVLGIVLPFAFPILVSIAAPSLWSTKSGSEQMVVWLVTAWTALPLTCWMRGVACFRIADAIDESRSSNASEPAPSH